MLSPPLAVSLYDSLVAVHVIFVIFAFGVLFAYPWLPKGTPEAHEGRAKLLSVVVTRGGGVAFLIGLGLAIDKSVMNKVWVNVPFALIIIILGVVGAVMTPRERALAHDNLEPEHRAETELLVQRAAYACMACVAIAVFFMVAKPGA